MGKGDMKCVQWLVSIALWGSLAGCNSSTLPTLTEKLPSGASPAIDLQTFDESTLPRLEAKVYQQVNQYRQSRNLLPLALNRVISQQARLHSQRMAAALVTLGHDGFDKRARAIAVTLPYESVGENVAMNQGSDDPVAIAVKGWIESKGHRENMVGDYNATGIGIAKNVEGEYYFTQLFVKKR
jgi:uncharacterized protein YkwD